MKKYISLPLFSLFFLLSSCLKEKYKLDIADNTSRVVAEFTEGGATELHSIAMDYSVGMIDVDIAELRILPRSVVNKDVQVTVELNPTLVADYNGLNGTSYVTPDNAVFQFTTGPYTFTPNSKITHLKIKTDPSLIIGNSYALGFTITTVTNGEAGLKKDYLVELLVKNIYEGNYHATGVRTRYLGTTIASGVRDNFPIDLDKDFLTYDQASVVGEAADAGSGLGDGLILTVDPVTNNVTITYIGGGAITPGSLVNQPGYNSTYDPATKTFDLYYWYVNPNLRTVHETLVLN